MAFTMCDGSVYVTACFLFIHWAFDGERKWLVYVIWRHLMYKKKQIHGSGTDFKETFKLFETIQLWIINRYQLSYLHDS